MTCTHAITVDLPFEQAAERTRSALADQGFGILTEIDVTATFAAKLGEEAPATAARRSRRSTRRPWSS